MWTIKQTNKTKQNSLARLTMVWWCPSPSEHHELLCTHQQTLHLKLCCLFQPNDSRPLHQLKDKFTQKSYITGLRTRFHQPLKHQSFVLHRKFKYKIQHYTIKLTLDIGTVMNFKGLVYGIRCLMLLTGNYYVVKYRLEQMTCQLSRSKYQFSALSAILFL